MRHLRLTLPFKRLNLFYKICPKSFCTLCMSVLLYEEDLSKFVFLCCPIFEVRLECLLHMEKWINYKMT
jgi:hypothetical protein